MSYADQSSYRAARENPSPETSVIDTLQSLIVAFVLAMTFRGFVLEGFIIPTGSMAPTLMGQHILWQSNQTGEVFPIDAGTIIRLAQNRRTDANGTFIDNSSFEIVDPYLGPSHVIDEQSVSQLIPKIRMGDRILVLKCMYPFAMPKRFDVVVFKNPTDPVGDTQNYIKRLIGLPSEKIWLVNGDVFAAPAAEPALEGFAVQRKPDHIQRAVWQPVSDSDAQPMHPERLRSGQFSPWTGEHWSQGERTLSCNTAAPTALTWNIHVRQIDDWTGYDMLLYQVSRRASEEPVNVSDVRVAAGIVAEQEGLQTTLELTTNDHTFEFTLADGQATVRMRQMDDTDWTSVSQSVDLPAAGDVINVEFWHVDQRMAIYLDGDLAVELKYDWSPEERLEYATGLVLEDALDAIEREELPSHPTTIEWHFAGSPVTLQRVRVDRDLYYRNDVLRATENEPRYFGPAFGTHPYENAAILGSDYYMMLGDNSTASLDSRLWGSAHRLVRQQITDADGREHQPFLVHRRLLIGKAFAVYFPAPYPLVDGGWGVVPDFGRLRFIR